jgi:hypothetical protein
MSKKSDVIRTAIYLLAGLALVPLSAPAHASECLSSPGASAPGRHWFYWTDKISNRRCWFAKETAEIAGRYRSGGSSPVRDQSRWEYEQALPVAPTEAESPVKSWFSSTFPTWDGWDSRTEEPEPAPNEATLPRQRSRNERTHLKTSQQSKQKHRSQRVHEPERAKHQAAHTIARVVEGAGDKDLPEATIEFEQNWQKVMEAVGKKPVQTPRTNVEDWQKALYEEFLVWRSKQIMFGHAD